MEALTVACVNVGNYLGMGDRYVATLRSMAARHLPPHQFECITESDKPGFWAKVDLFQPGRFTGRVIYFDLDLVISGDLSGLVGLFEQHDFWALDDFAWPLSNKDAIEAQCRAIETPAFQAAVVRNLGNWGTCNSSVMLWRDEAGRDIYERYSPEAAEGLHGDQNWINRVMAGKINLIPAQFARSYRLGPYTPHPITVYHGDGKPHEVHDPDWY